MRLNLLSSSCLNRTRLTGLGRTPLWRSCTCSVRRAGVWTTGFLRSASPSADLGPAPHLLRCCKASYLEILILMDRMTLFLLIPGYSWGGFPSRQHGAGPRGPREPSPLVPSMPRWLSFFMWMRSGMPQERRIDPHSLCGWGLERKEKRVLRPVVPQSKCRTLKHAQQEKKRCWERGLLRKGLFKDVLFAEQHDISCSQRKCFPLSRIVLIL